jgi:hypothetical protein
VPCPGNEVERCGDDSQNAVHTGSKNKFCLMVLYMKPIDKRIYQIFLQWYYSTVHLMMIIIFAATAMKPVIRKHWYLRSIHTCARTCACFKIPSVP